MEADTPKLFAKAWENRHDFELRENVNETGEHTCELDMSWERGSCPLMS